MMNKIETAEYLNIVREAGHQVVLAPMLGFYDSNKTLYVDGIAKGTIIDGELTLNK